MACTPPALNAICRFLCCVASLTLTPFVQAADWEPVAQLPNGTVHVDTDSVRYHGQQLEAWVWFQPHTQTSWQRIATRHQNIRPMTEAKERVSIDCSARQYRINDFEPRPHSPRYLGRSNETVPGSEADAVLQWLCQQ